MFYDLSREFKWVPDQIRRVTLQELEHYYARSFARRDTVPEPDVTLAQIRQALFAVFGLKEPSHHTEAELDAELKTVSALCVTKEESEAWLAAGMPSPIKGWLKGYRDERRRSGSQTEGGPA